MSICLIGLGTLFFSVLYMISLQPAGLSLRLGDRAYSLCGVIRMISMLFELAVVAGYILFAIEGSLGAAVSAENDIAVRIAGVVITAGSLGFMFYGAWIAGQEAAAPVLDGKLYGGIYNHMRHPQTLGEMISWFGLSMILNSMTLLVFSLIWIPLFISYTVIEDNDLAVRFGSDYIEYTKKVGLFGRKKHNR